MRKIFTLAEVLFCPAGHRKRAFTLAEVLITLVIIGIVSMLVVHVVYNRVQGYAFKRSHMVFYSKIKSALQLMQGANALAGYQTTEQFVEQFKKYIKIVKVCQKDELASCFPAKIKQADGKSYDINNNLTLKNFRGNSIEDRNNTNVMGIILQDGTNVLLAYNPLCTGIEGGGGSTLSVDMDCISLAYDLNSNKKPNIVGGTFSYEVSLGEKEDNSNVGKIKDISSINGTYFAKPITKTEEFQLPTFASAAEAAAGKNGVTFTPAAAYKGIGKDSIVQLAYHVGGHGSYELVFDFTDPVKIKKVVEKGGGVYNVAYETCVVQVKASNNRIDWVVIDTSTNCDSNFVSYEKEFDLTGEYRFYSFLMGHIATWHDSSHKGHSLGMINITYDKTTLLN